MAYNAGKKSYIVKLLMSGKKLYHQRFGEKQMFYTLTKPPTPPLPPPQSRQSQILGPQPNFLALIGNQFLQVWGSAIKIAWYN